MSRPRRFDWLFRPQMADADLPLSSEARFAEALAELPAVERSALALSEIGGLDADEIAERLGTDAAVVHRLLTRARESMRATLAVRGRRGLSAVLPLQSWWQTGSGGPAMRAAGLVVAAVVAPGVVIGGAAADSPRAVAAVSESPRVAAIERAHRAGLVAPPARTRVTAIVVVPKRQPAIAGRPAARPAVVEPRRAPVTAPARPPVLTGPPASAPATPAAVPQRTEIGRPAPPAPPPAPRPAAAQRVATTVQGTVSLPPPLPIQAPETTALTVSQSAAPLPAVSMPTVPLPEPRTAPAPPTPLTPPLP